MPEEVVKKYLYHEDARDGICELFKNLWKSGLMVSLHDAWLAFSIGVEQYADNEMRYKAIEHGDCIVTAWLVLNEKTFPLDPNSQDVIELCNNMHKHVSHDIYPCLILYCIVFLLLIQLLSCYLLGCIIICSNECQSYGMGS